jgi:hypothetical protein
VDGAAVGYGVGVDDGVGVGDGDGVGVGVGVGDAAGDVVESAEGLPAGELAGVLLGTAVNEAVPVTDGVMTGVVEPPAEQAESTMQARMAKTAPPTAARRPPGTDPAIVVRAFMEPPDGSGGWRILFPIPAPETASEQKSSWPARSLPRPADGRSGESADGP